MFFPQEERLAEALTLIERLEAEVARLESEGGEFRTMVLTQDLDLTNIRATKALLDGKVQDLEAKVSEQTSPLSQANLLLLPSV